ncbi:hypothetical protein ACQKML_00190 [Peribacillus frigoritolerans]
MSYLEFLNLFSQQFCRRCKFTGMIRDFIHRRAGLLSGGGDLFDSCRGLFRNGCDILPGGPTRSCRSSIMRTISAVRLACDSEPSIRSNVPFI